MRSKERVDALGEVFTPRELVVEMLDRLPQESWTDKSKTFCDPACGNGNFLVEVVRRKVESGYEPITALQTTYGVDIMTDNVTECQRRLIAVAAETSGKTPDEEWGWTVLRNIVKHDSLTYDFEFAPKERSEKRLSYVLSLLAEARNTRAW